MLVVLGSYLTATLFISPDSVVESFDTSGTANAQVHVMLAGRFLAMVIALAAALMVPMVTRSPIALAVVLLMRFLTEIADAFAALRVGSGSGYGSVLFAVLELIALGWLFRYWRATKVYAATS